MHECVNNIRARGQRQFIFFLDTLGYRKCNRNFFKSDFREELFHDFKVILLNGLLDPGAQFGLFEGDEKLVFGRLEAHGRLLSLVVQGQVDVDDLGAAFRLGGRVQVVGDGGDMSGADQTQPSLEEGNLGQARRISFLLKKGDKKVVIKTQAVDLLSDIGGECNYRFLKIK